MYKLVISDDEGKTTIVPLIRDEITIGRKEGNTVRLTDRNVSRSHARLIREEDGSFVLNDQKSRNGTKVNGELVGTRARRIGPGDQIAIGDYSISIRTDVAESVPMGRQMKPGEDAGIGKVTPHARLVMLTGPEPGRETDLTLNLYVLGRSEEANLRIEDPSISRAHARLDGEDHQWTISDLDSINGVMINGFKRDDYLLKPGDVIEVGTVQLRFVAPGEPYEYDPEAAAARVRKGRRRGRLVSLLAGAAALAVLAIILLVVLPSSDGVDEVKADDPDDPTGGLDFDELIERGKDQMQLEEWAEAARYFARATTISPSSTIAGDLRRLALTEMEAQSAHKAGSTALQSFEWREAMEQFATIPRSSRYWDRSLMTRAAGMVCEEMLEYARLAVRGGDMAMAEAALGEIDSLPEVPEDCASARNALRTEFRRRKAPATPDEERKSLPYNPYDAKPRKSAIENPYATGGRSSGSGAAGREAEIRDPMAEARRALDRGDTAGAIAILERGGNGRPVLALLAQLYLKQGNKAGYERVARRFIRLYPNDPASDQFRRSLGI